MTLLADNILKEKESLILEASLEMKCTAWGNRLTYLIILKNYSLAEVLGKKLINTLEEKVLFV